MNILTIRRLYKFLIIPGVLLVGLLFLDYYANDARAFITLIILAMAYIGVLLLLLLLPADDRASAFIQPPETDSMSVHYPPSEARK